MLADAARTAHSPPAGGKAIGERASVGSIFVGEEGRFGEGGALPGVAFPSPVCNCQETNDLRRGNAELRGFGRVHGHGSCRSGTNIQTRNQFGGDREFDRALTKYRTGGR